MVGGELQAARAGVKSRAVAAAVRRMRWEDATTVPVMAGEVPLCTPSGRLGLLLNGWWAFSRHTDCGRPGRASGCFRAHLIPGQSPLQFPRVRLALLGP